MKERNTHFVAKLLVIAGMFIIGAGIYAYVSSSSMHLQEVPYTDHALNFSIRLPEGWQVRATENSAKVSSIWFYNASSTATTSASMAIERFIRTPETNKTIKMFGDEAFTQGLIESLWVDLDLNILKNERMMIGDAPVIHIHSTYEGKGTKREVTQHMYFTFIDNYYYRIGIDVYSDISVQEKDILVDSVNTFRILPQ
ncbi:MAG: hypothetical protein AAB381_00770 [Patescibacteria group bacterium]